METNKLTKEQLQVALCEIRKAHRLIYEYQRRMQDLIGFITDTLGFNKSDVTGWQFFGNELDTIHRYRLNKSTWDWITTYVYQYVLGENKSCKLAIIQVSDTGFYKNNVAEQTKLDTFASPEESESKLLFYLSIKPKNANLDWDPRKIIKEYAAQENKFYTIENKTKKQIIYPVPLQEFINKEATLQILKKFVEYCNKEAGTNLFPLYR